MDEKILETDSATEEIVEDEKPIADEKDLWLTGDDDEINPEEAEETEELDDTETEETETEETEEVDDKKVSVRKHIQMKQKLKKRASEKEKEAERLREENEELKRKLRDTAPDMTTKKLVRPDADDFDTTEEFREAVVKYEQDLVDQRLQIARMEEEQKSKHKAYLQQREEAVDAHYERAAKLIDESKIDPDVYRKVEERVFSTVEEVIPNMGTATVDHLISMMGEGSEKVLYYIGRNKNVLNEFKASLASDRTGLTVTLFLGRLLEKLNGTKNKTSHARPPAPDIKGDKGTPKGEALLLNKYKAAHKKGNYQEAFNIKRQAKEKGIDTKAWATQL